MTKLLSYRAPGSWRVGGGMCSVYEWQPTPIPAHTHRRPWIQRWAATSISSVARPGILRAVGAFIDDADDDAGVYAVSCAGLAGSVRSVGRVGAAQVGTVAWRTRGLRCVGTVCLLSVGYSTRYCPRLRVRVGVRQRLFFFIGWTTLELYEFTLLYFCTYSIMIQQGILCYNV